MDNESMLAQYDEFAVKHLAAYNAFATIFEAQNPRPTLATISRDTVSLIIVLALAVVMVAAVIVSGSRTVDEFAPDGLPGIGIIAFVMVEGGIMAYAFFRARRGANKERLQSTVRWATAGLILTVIVGLGANVDSTLRSHGVFMPEGVKTFLNLLVAISAPALGFISSDVLAIELMATDIKRRDAQRDYELALAAWQERLNNSWRSKQADWGVKVKVEQPERLALPEYPVFSSKIQENTRFTPSRKLQAALDWLQEHPDQLSEESRKLAEIIGVSHTTVNKAQRIMRGDNSVM